MKEELSRSEALGWMVLPVIYLSAANSSQDFVSQISRYLEGTHCNSKIQIGLGKAS